MLQSAHNWHKVSFKFFNFMFCKTKENQQFRSHLLPYGENTSTLLDVSNFQFILLEVQIKNPYPQFIACGHFLHITITIIVFMPKTQDLPWGSKGEKRLKWWEEPNCKGLGVPTEVYK